MGKQIITIKDRVEMERKAKNYGFLSIFAKQLPTFYPGYSQKRAIDDILNGRDTVDADILFATCTTDNHSEFYLSLQDQLLQHLHRIIGEVDISQVKDVTTLYDIDQSELVQCFLNYNETYHRLCQRYSIEPKDRTDRYQYQNQGLRTQTAPRNICRVEHRHRCFANQLPKTPEGIQGEQPQTSRRTSECICK